MHIDSPTFAGGEAVYMSSEFRFEIVSNLSLDIDRCENIWLKLHYADLLLGVINQHLRSNVKLFTKQLNKRLNQFKIFKVYLIGNVNINLSLAINASNDIVLMLIVPMIMLIYLLVMVIFLLSFFLHELLLFLLLLLITLL